MPSNEIKHKPKKRKLIQDQGDWARIALMAIFAVAFMLSATAAQASPDEGSVFLAYDVAPKVQRPLPNPSPPASTRRPEVMAEGCEMNDVFVKHLGDTYKEEVIGLGLSITGALVQVLVAPDGGWTMIVTGTNMVSCGFASGTGWEYLVPDAPASGS